MTVGIDLQEYYISTEWDIMDVPAVRTEKYYPCCEEPYPDIYFYLSLRRKSLFYTGWQAIHILKTDVGNRPGSEIGSSFEALIST